MGTSIRRIRKIGDYRAFKDWTDERCPVEFETINLIYGANGSGKSTLASLVRGAADGVAFPSAPGLVAEVEHAGKRLAINETDMSFWHLVKVFNADYVRENLRFDDVDGPTSESLLTLGKINVETETELERAEDRAEQLAREIPKAKKAAKRAERALKSGLTGVADTVVADLRRSSVPDYRSRSTYTTTKVQRLLKGDQSVFEEASTDVDRDVERAVSELKPEVELARRGKMMGPEWVGHIQEVLSQDVVVNALDELLGHEGRSAWVQAGIPLHADLDTCLFCGQAYTPYRRRELSDHFSDSLTRLQGEADRLIADLKASVENSKRFADEIPHDLAVYKEFAGQLRDARVAYLSSHDLYQASVSHIIKALESKRNNPFQLKTLDPYVELRLPDIETVVQVVRKHNQRSREHAQAALEAARCVELYRVSGFRARYRSLSEESKIAQENATKLEKDLSELRRRILELQNVEADPVPKADELTGNVRRLLGRDELRFVPTPDGKRYLIERGGLPATHLSEGERTAIALLHFLTGLREEPSVGASSIVVVDDPVSSMDESILFGASAFLWTELVRKNPTGQVFVLTHNFEFFRQWLIQLENAKRHIKGGYTVNELVMRYVDAPQGGLVRKPQLIPWTKDERMSRRLRSHYHFLFAHVAGAVVASGQEIGMAERMNLLALAPNAARKMMEAFLSFKFPNLIGNFHGGMEAALEFVQEPAVRHQVERYLHAYSHNEEGDMSATIDPIEATQIFRSLFLMIQAVDGGHLSSMCKALLINEEALVQMPVVMTSAEVET